MTKNDYHATTIPKQTFTENSNNNSTSRRIIIRSAHEYMPTKREEKTNIENIQNTNINIWFDIFFYEKRSNRMSESAREMSVNQTIVEWIRTVFSCVWSNWSVYGDMWKAKPKKQRRTNRTKQNQTKRFAWAFNRRFFIARHCLFFCFLIRRT